MVKIKNNDKSFSEIKKNLHKMVVNAILKMEKY